MTQAEAAGEWLPGDRLPNVPLQGADGPALYLHADLAGAPLWLATPTTADARAVLPAPPDGVIGLCLASADAGDAPLPWRTCTVDTRWLARLGADALWQADPNLRLSARHSLPVTGLAGPAKVAIIGSEQAACVAPVLQIPDVFEAGFCEALIQHLEVDCGGGEASAVRVIEGGKETLHVDPGVKRRRESPPRNASIEARMHEKLMRRALPEIARVFSFSVARRDPFKLLAYPEGAGYFRPHRDNETPDVAHRRFALSVNLNQGLYEGGEFRYPEFGPHLYSPKTGTALIFSCGLLHEVLPVERGTRYAMTTFLA